MKHRNIELNTIVYSKGRPTQIIVNSGWITVLAVLWIKQWHSDIIRNGYPVPGRPNKGGGAWHNGKCISIWNRNKQTLPPIGIQNSNSIRKIDAIFTFNRQYRVSLWAGSFNVFTCAFRWLEGCYVGVPKSNKSGHTLINPRLNIPIGISLMTSYVGVEARIFLSPLGNPVKWFRKPTQLVF